MRAGDFSPDFLPLENIFFKVFFLLGFFPVKKGSFACLGDGSELCCTTALKLSSLQNSQAMSCFREEYTNISSYSDNSSCIYSPFTPFLTICNSGTSRGRDKVHMLVLNCLSMAWLIELSVGYCCQLLNPSRVGNNIPWQ